jgi:hypothetical protein
VQLALGVLPFGPNHASTKAFAVNLVDRILGHDLFYLRHRKFLVVLELDENFPNVHLSEESIVTEVAAPECFRKELPDNLYLNSFLRNGRVFGRKSGQWDVGTTAQTESKTSENAQWKPLRTSIPGAPEASRT